MPNFSLNSRERGLAMEEEQLIEQAKKGDHEAFRQLVTHYYPVVERFAYQIGNPAHDVEDVTQEVFLRVYRFLHTYHDARFTTWLYKITLNISRDMMRKKKRQQNKLKKWLSDVSPLFVANDDPLLKKEEHRFLHEIIVQLPEKYRVPLVLFYFHEKKYEEIADILQIPLATVKTRISRARKKLQHHWVESEVSKRVQ